MSGSPLHRVLRVLMALLGPLVVVWVLTVSYMALNESSYIFFPEPLAPGQDPAAVGLSFEDVQLPLDGTTTVHGWWIPGPGGPEAPVVLFLHGNAGSLGGRLGILASLVHLPRPLGGVLAIDYPGYGRSTGKPSERSLAASARRARDHLVGDRGVTPDRLVLYGRSLGAAVALRTAVEHPCAGVVLGVPFLSIPALARVHYPWIPGLGLLVRQRFDNGALMPRLRVPHLILYGPEDRIVPPSHPRRLHGLATVPGVLVPIPGAGHDDTWSRDPAVWTHAWVEFLDRCVPAPSLEGGNTTP